MVVSGRPFTITVHNAPGMMLDYVAVFACRSLFDCDSGPDYNAAVYVVPIECFLVLAEMH
jgi:hypothetical protein